MPGTRQTSDGGVRLRHPNADEHEQRLRLAALRLDRATLVRWLGWDPEHEGYYLPSWVLLDLLERALTESGPR